MQARRVSRAVSPEALLEKVWPPMLATLSTASEASAATHVFEVKYDGIRGLAAICRGRLAFVSRNGKDLGARFPHLARALSNLDVRDAVLDGEVVAIDPGGISRFQLLQSGATPQRFVVFDLLWLEGADLRARPLSDRWNRLSTLLAQPPRTIELAERLEGSTEHVLEAARRRGLEGVLAKERDSPYLAGRCTEWLKIKIESGQELAIVGFTAISSGEKAIGALLLGVRDRRGFRYAGKVGTGFSSAMRHKLWSMLRKDVVSTPSVLDPPRESKSSWVKPRRVAQIAFTEWTRDGRLRHPSFRGLRDDKKPEDCWRERPVAPAETRTGAAR
jgi:bifunctional non-homologous end joining protein LigD